MSAGMTKHQEGGQNAYPEIGEFRVPEANFLDVVVGQDGVRMDLDKVATVVNPETPTCLANAHSFIGLGDFCRLSIKDFGKLSLSHVALTMKRYSSCGVFPQDALRHWAHLTKLTTTPC